MSIKPFLSRRNFMKSTAMVSSTLLGISSLSACSETENNNRKADKFPENTIKNHQLSDGVSGLLFSQIGYEFGLPVRIIVRLPKKALLRGQTTCKLIPSLQEKSYQTDLNYWGEIWGSHWWIADFRTINETGEWNIEVIDGKEWVENPAQSAMIISLEELLEKKKEVFNSVFLERIYTQITVGCEYLVMTQAKAEELGFPEGSMSHDLKGHEKDILPHDAMKAVVALAKAVQLLPEEFADKKQKYTKTAKKAFQWLVGSAKPMGEYGYMKMQRGLPANTEIPKDEWLTRDLLVMCRASMEMSKLGDSEAKELAVVFARKVMARQIPKEKAESGLYGHFYEFDSMIYSEPSWCHGIVPSEKGVEFGADMGGIYPNYLMPVIDLLQVNPGHTDASKWKKTKRNRLRKPAMAGRIEQWNYQ